MTHILILGIAVLDDVYALPMSLVPGAKHRANAMKQVVGGTAANAALAIARLGGKASLITRMGNDSTAAILRERLQAAGVDLSLSGEIPGCASSRSAIIIEPNGERTIVNLLDPDLPDAPEWLFNTLPATTSAVLADVRWESAARRLFTLARRAGLPAIFDGDRAPDDLGLLDLATHTAFSAQGLRELTGINDLATALNAIARAHDGFFAVTNGAEGVFAMLDGTIEHYAAFPITPVDTLGAGDVWHGAFALCIGEGRPVREAIRLASAAAAIKCMRPGGSAGAPNRSELDAFLAASPLSFPRIPEHYP